MSPILRTKIQELIESILDQEEEESDLSLLGEEILELIEEEDPIEEY